MNLPPAWVAFFESAGFSAYHWSLVGDPRAPDEALMAWARDHDALVFTHDLDFARILAMTGERGPSVLQIRALDLIPSGLGPAVLEILRRHREDLERGAIVTLDGRTSRVRILPIHGPSGRTT